MIIHPITLYLCDELRSFRRILDVLSARPTAHLSEVIPAEGAPAPTPEVNAHAHA
jgi:hypothetical protein